MLPFGSVTAMHLVELVRLPQLDGAVQLPLFVKCNVPFVMARPFAETTDTCPALIRNAGELSTTNAKAVKLLEYERYVVPTVVW